MRFLDGFLILYTDFKYTFRPLSIYFFIFIVRVHLTYVVCYIDIMYVYSTYIGIFSLEIPIGRYIGVLLRRTRARYNNTYYIITASAFRHTIRILFVARLFV